MLCFQGIHFSYRMEFTTLESFTSLGFDDHEARMLKDAHSAVFKADKWEYLRDPTTPGKDGFIFCKDIELSHILAEMEYQGHTGASFAWVMRQMEAIAKGSWDDWANRMRYLKSAQSHSH